MNQAKSKSPASVCELQAGSHRISEDVQVLKGGDTFALFDHAGQIGMPGDCEQGLYHLGTRHLSKWELFINGQRPMLLNATVKQDNSLLVVQMTTRDLNIDGEVLPQGTLHLFRSLVVEESSFYEHLRLTNYSRMPLDFQVEYRFGADYHDIFEVRGAVRASRGELGTAAVSERSVVLSYQGLDDRHRQTEIDFDGDIQNINESCCVSDVRLDGGAEQIVHATIHCVHDSTNGKRERRSHAEAVAGIDSRAQEEELERTELFTSNVQFNEWIDRSFADLQMLTTNTVYGRYPYAGVPWFATPFGRDGIITALETVWLRPRLARGVLSFLAATQASEVDPAAEAEPGKIIHEMREGEMAALGEVPYRRYYGTVDATPLFVVLAGHYYRRTGDRDFIEFIWCNLRRAIQWIDDYGDIDGDGFVEYVQHSESGLVNQCWKDSNDSIFHADGRDATGPIAVAEVQGYVYEAKLFAAEMGELFGEIGWAKRLRQEAEQLKANFNEAFWVRSIDTFAIALDGEKRPCAVRNSNAGHLLYSGIIEEQYAAQVAAALTDNRAFNGWGIRTISEGEVRFNPMSYHNGSVWPHDTAMAAAGFARYGFRQECSKILTGLFDASQYNELHRLPELFCGFERLQGHAPTSYPVACSPQAWATGAVFLLLQSILGMSFSPSKPQVRFDNPQLPDYLDWVRIKNLRIGDGTVDLALRRHPRDVGLNVEHKEGEIQIVVVG